MLLFVACLSFHQVSVHFLGRLAARTEILDTIELFLTELCPLDFEKILIIFTFPSFFRTGVGGGGAMLKSLIGYEQGLSHDQILLIFQKRLNIDGETYLNVKSNFTTGV